MIAFTHIKMEILSKSSPANSQIGISMLHSNSKEMKAYAFEILMTRTSAPIGNSFEVLCNLERGALLRIINLGVSTKQLLRTYFQ